MDENEEVIDKEDNEIPLILRNKRNAKQKCCGKYFYYTVIWNNTYTY